MKLGRDVFVALATIVWADGVVTDDEARALEEAARASGLSGADLDAVRAATHERPKKDVLAALKLTQDERCFVYAIAAWLARADGKVTPEETEALADLGDLFGLGDDDRACAIAASYAIGVYEESPAVSVRTLAREIERASEAR